MSKKEEEIIWVKCKGCYCLQKAIGKYGHIHYHIADEDYLGDHDVENDFPIFEKLEQYLDSKGLWKRTFDTGGKFDVTWYKRDKKKVISVYMENKKWDVINYFSKKEIEKFDDEWRLHINFVDNEVVLLSFLNYLHNGCH